MERFGSALAAILATCLLLLGTTTAQPSYCQLDFDTGPCRGYFPRYYYDATTGDCLPFVYGGCEGNANNFATPDECVAACGVDICLLPQDPGPCFAYIERWYYDSATNDCQPFVYGGCQGNANNFATRDECLAGCGVDPCSLQRDPGTCTDYVTKYYYDLVDGACKSFLYGGCLGNANNFDTPDLCRAYCGARKL